MTYRDSMRLRDYTTNQLVEELARRANSVTTQKPEHWCCDCTHFVTWLDRQPTPRDCDCPQDYNPCTKRHQMKFIAPQEITDEYGFYLPVCADRKQADVTDITETL